MCTGARRSLIPPLLAAAVCAPPAHAADVTSGQVIPYQGTMQRD